ncbi:MAG: hypothetical protein M3478_15195 [Planctomycetota bacterium]|nr:hypothetical protein [Planctomycetota bacterium]
MRIASFAVVAFLVCCTWTMPAGAQTTRPAANGVKSSATTRPTGKSAEEMLNQLLRPTGEAKPAPSAATVETGGVDATSGSAAVAPGAPVVTVMREGTDIVNRVGRLTRGTDGQQWEFTFESDGRTMLDPPLIILPNLNLTKMESTTAGMTRDLRFRVTGEVTEYRGRNYILLRKVMVVADAEKQF